MVAERFLVRFVDLQALLLEEVDQVRLHDSSVILSSAFWKFTEHSWTFAC